MCTISKIWTGSRRQSLGAVGSSVCRMEHTWSAAGTSSRKLVLALSSSSSVLYSLRERAEGEGGSGESRYGHRLEICTYCQTREGTDCKRAHLKMTDSGSEGDGHNHIEGDSRSDRTETPDRADSLPRTETNTGQKGQTGQ